MDDKNGNKRFIMVLQNGWESRMTSRYEYFTTQEESQTRSSVFVGQNMKNLRNIKTKILE